MCPAVRNRDRRAALARGARQPIVAGIAVQLQDAVEALQDLLRVHAGAARAVSEDHAGRVIAAPAPIISGQRPEEASLRPASPGLQNRRRRFVHEEFARALQVLGEPVDFPDRPVQTKERWKAAVPTQSAGVLRRRSIPERARIWLWR